MSSTIVIIITLLVAAKIRTSSYTVFFSTINQTGFSFSYVCLIGILPTVFSFSGFDAAGQLSEETRHASRKAPLAIIGTCASAAIIGFIYLLALMYAAGNPLDLVKKPSNPSATVQIFQISTPSSAALSFTILLIICLYFAGMSATTVSSRICYAMAHDNLFPYSKYLSIVYQRTHTPLPCVLLVCVINILLLLLQLVSTTAFAAIISISNIGFQFSYMLPILFRITSSRKTFVKGHFNLGRFSFIIGLLSAMWLFITCIILVFPYNYPITAENFNWTIVVCSVVGLFAGLYWIFSAGKQFRGPHRMSFVEAPPLPTISVTVF